MLGLSIILFLFCACCVALVVVAMVFWRIFPYRQYNTLRLQNLPAWERWYLYFVAIYPILSGVAILATGIYASENLPRTHYINQPPDRWFFIIHAIISSYSLAVCRYLYKQHKVYGAFLILTLIAGSLYYFASIWGRVL